MGKRGEMRVQDLGEMTEPVAVYGGPVSNLHAALALMDALDAEGIAQHRRVCTGDLAAYCADPGPTATLVRERGGHVLAGNCERQLAEGRADCGCGFQDGTACDAMSGAWWTRASAEPGRRHIEPPFADEDAHARSSPAPRHVASTVPRERVGHGRDARRAERMQ